MLDHDEALDEERPSSKDGDELQARVLRRLDEAVNPQIQIRFDSLRARRFVNVPGAQWDDEWGEQFANSPRLEHNKVGRAIRKIENDYRQNRIVPDFRPAGGSSDNDTADTLDGMHRADSYRYKAQQGRDNAYSEASQGGFGAYRLTTELADPLDKDSDEQRVNPAMLITDADQCVFFDPNSKLYDKSDAGWAIVLTGTTPDVFEEDYEDEAPSSFPEGTIKPSYEWFRPDYVIIAEYYEITQGKETLLIFRHEISDEEQRIWERDIEDDERKKLKALGFKVTKRSVPRRTCMKSVHSGATVLEHPKRIAGGQIPIVPVYCYRSFIDGVEHFKGIVQDKMGPQRLYNSTISRIAEVNALAPFEKPILTPDQVAGHETSWAQGNINRSPYQLINAMRNEDGTIASLGPVGKVEPPQVPQTAAALLEISNRDLTEDDQEPDEVKANTSADAMDIAAARVDAKSGFMLDNMRQSVQREGELYLGIACEVYCEEGRKVETMTEEGDDGEATLFEDVDDNGQLKVRNNFRDGKYKVIASVTEATTTRRDRTVKSSLAIAEIAITAQNPDLANAALLTAVMNQDGEGMDDFQKYARKQSLKIGLAEPTEDETKAAEQQAEQAQQEPDPALEIAKARVAKDMSAAQVNQAKVGETKANTLLKVAQAQAVGGPEAVPDAPSGLQAANDVVDLQERSARARLHDAQARKIDADIPIQRIKTGHEIEMARRQQDHAERAANG